MKKLLLAVLRPHLACRKAWRWPTTTGRRNCETARLGRYRLTSSTRPNCPLTPFPGLAARQYWGVQQGAGYRIEVPENWNGKLVMWAHGFRGTGLELTV